MTRFCLAVLVSIASFATPALTEDVNNEYATIRKNKGTVEVETIIKRKGVDCPTDVTKNCKPGQACVSSVQIEGEAAKQIYTMLKAHGVQSNEVEGDYVATKSQALTCSETDGKYYCGLGYDGRSNTLVPTTLITCEGE